MTRGRTAQAALERQKTRQAQIQRQVDKRDQQLKSSAAVHYQVGTWVYIQVPKVDQSVLGGGLLRLVIVEAHDDTGMYRLASEHGLLKTMVDAQQIFKPAITQTPADDIMEAWRADKLKKQGLRALHKAVDMFGGQGKQCCKCTKGCKTMTCGCRKARPSAQCQSACHCNKLGNCHNSSAFLERWIRLAPGQNDNAEHDEDCEHDLEDEQ